MNDLKEAATSARNLVNDATAVHALRDESPGVAAELLRQLNKAFPEACAAIKKVAMELRCVRESVAAFGDVTAPTAHEAAVELVYILNRGKFGVEIVGRKPVENWPDPDELCAAIELEYSQALDRRKAESRAEPDNQSEEEADRRIVVDMARKTLTFDGKDYDVSSERALKWVDRLAENPGEWVSGTDFEFPLRTDKLKEFLHSEILALIESKPGAGSRLQL